MSQNNIADAEEDKTQADSELGGYRVRETSRERQDENRKQCPRQYQETGCRWGVFLNELPKTG